MDGSTTNSTNSVTSNVCQISNGHEDDWKILYESAFPLDERTPVDDLRKFFTAGNCLLHKTTNKAGELQCFSVVHLMSNFILLAYIATDTTKRSTGVGSKHMKQLIENLKKSHAGHIGLFLEIESTKEPGLDDETLKARTRRLAFYQRLGAKRLQKKYQMPVCSGNGAARQGELLWLEFDSQCVTEEAMPKVITELYEKAYGLKSDDSVVTQVVSQWSTANPATGTADAASESKPACACTEAPIADSGSHPTQTATATETATATATAAGNADGSAQVSSDKKQDETEAVPKMQETVESPAPAANSPDQPADSVVALDTSKANDKPAA
ncbi:MAG TPA: hypothetical protein V6C72_08890 [Chroococcales cyanobacterium]